MQGIVTGLALIALALPATAGAQLPVGGEMEGVEHVRNIPVNGSVGANFKTYDDGKTYMFVTGTVGMLKADPGLVSQMNYGGLWVYDVTTAPDNPRLVTHLPYPHYENEDVSIGGNRLLISGDGTLGGSVLTVVDISNPAAPAVEHVAEMWVDGPGHTATCIQECRYVWVAGDDTVYVVDLTKLDGTPVSTGELGETELQPGFFDQEYREFGWTTHDVQVDEAGYAWVVGGNGTIAFDVREGSYGAGNLLDPTPVARTGGDALEGSEVNNFIHHNSWRPDAAEFEGRKDNQLKKKGVKPGETVLITEEDIWSDATLVTKGGCENQGSFQTWQVKQLAPTSSEESTMKHLDTFTTEFNELIAGDDVDGKDLIPTNGFCSSHYFDERDGLVATAWYEQGTRLLDVRDPSNIKQVGYFLAPDSVVWSAKWSPTDPSVIYVLDHQRGIDVLRVGEAALSGQAKAVRARAIPKWFRAGSRARNYFRAGSRARRGIARPKADPRFGWVCRVRQSGVASSERQR